MKNVTLDQLTTLLIEGGLFCFYKTVRGYLEFVKLGSPKDDPNFRACKEANNDIKGFMVKNGLYHDIINYL